MGTAKSPFQLTLLLVVIQLVQQSCTEAPQVSYMQSFYDENYHDDGSNSKSSPPSHDEHHLEEMPEEEPSGPENTHGHEKNLGYTPTTHGDHHRGGYHGNAKRYDNRGHHHHHNEEEEDDQEHESENEEQDHHDHHRHHTSNTRAGPTPKSGNHKPRPGGYGYGGYGVPKGYFERKNKPSKSYGYHSYGPHSYSTMHVSGAKSEESKPKGGSGYRHEHNHEPEEHSYGSYGEPDSSPKGGYGGYNTDSASTSYKGASESGDYKDIPYIKGYPPAGILNTVKGGYDDYGYNDHSPSSPYKGNSYKPTTYAYSGPSFTEYGGPMKSGGSGTESGPSSLTYESSDMTKGHSSGGYQKGDSYSSYRPKAKGYKPPTYLSYRSPPKSKTKGFLRPPKIYGPLSKFVGIVPKMYTNAKKLVSGSSYQYRTLPQGYNTQHASTSGQQKQYEAPSRSYGSSPKSAAPSGQYGSPSKSGPSSTQYASYSNSSPSKQTYGAQSSYGSQKSYSRPQNAANVYNYNTHHKGDTTAPRPGHQHSNGQGQSYQYEAEGTKAPAKMADDSGYTSAYGGGYDMGTSYY